MNEKLGIQMLEHCFQTEEQMSDNPIHNSSFLISNSTK